MLLTYNQYSHLKRHTLIITYILISIGLTKLKNIVFII